MTLHQIVSTSVFGGSILLLLFVLIFPILSGLRRRFVRIGTAIYVSGTGLVFLVSNLRPTIPPNFVWISEIFIFGIYAFTCGLVIFLSKNDPQGPANGSSNEDNKEP